jgi:hypothetical protein
MAKQMGSKPAPTSDYDEEKWRAESDLRTLIDAEKIKADPKRMKAAMKCRAEMKKAVDAIEG